MFWKVRKVKFPGCRIFAPSFRKRDSVLPHGVTIIIYTMAKGPGGWPTKNGTSHKSGGGRDNNPPK